MNAFALLDEDTRKRFAALFSRWQNSVDGCEWETPEEAWACLSKRGYTPGKAKLSRRKLDMPWGPNNVSVGRIFKPDPEAWDSTVARFKSRLALATPKSIARTITKVQNHELWPATEVFLKEE